MTFVMYGCGAGWESDSAPTKKESIGDVVARVVKRNVVELGTRLDAAPADAPCPFYGFTANDSSGKSRHPLGCYALREPRCVLGKGVAPLEYERCESVYQPTLVLLGRAPASSEAGDQ